MTQPINDRKQSEPWLDSEENYDPMSHSEAVALNAVELYVVHKLSPEQDRRFEEHYFECPECAGAVAVEQALAERAALPRTKPRTWWQRLALPVMIPATAVMATLLISQHAEISRLEAPHANTRIVALEGNLMGADEGESLNTDSVTIEFNLPTDKPVPPFYNVRIFNGGHQTHSVIVPAPQGNFLHESIQVRSSTLQSGVNELSVYAPGGGIVQTYKFKVKR